MMPSAPSAPLNVIAPVATPLLSAQLGYVKVRGMWAEGDVPAASKWSARRTARVRWQPSARLRRQEWKTQEP